MSWNPKYVLLILSTTIISYLAAIFIDRPKSKISRKLIVFGSSCFCLGILFFFKYFNFFEETIVAAVGMFGLKAHPISLNLLLPVGVSFYTFQTMSYVFDVYNGKVSAEHHFGKYATFISFFPQLVAGPIERTNNLLPQIKSEKTFDYELSMYGARQILWGVFKKIAVADVVAIYVDRAYSQLTECTSFDFCITIFFFTVQIYCDFSGYSDIAIGTAKLFGINLMRNFESPYFSLSIREFWSRWHISLSTWFRDYVYIPLGGNRCSKLKTNINVLITFLISGLWHGANWTFVLWGGIHGAGQIIENLITKKARKKGALEIILSWIIVFFFCNLAWVFFRANSVKDAIFVIRNAFCGFPDISGYFHSHIGLSIKRLIFIFFTIAFVAIFDLLSIKTDLFSKAATHNRFFIVGIEYIILGITLFAFVSSTGTNQFVYFQF